VGIDIIIMIIAMILMLIAAIMAAVYKPKIVPPFAAGLSEFTVPRAEAGNPIPVIFGTVRLKGPNVVWYGDKQAEPIPAPSTGSS
jgi:hypothetical protein